MTARWPFETGDEWPAQDAAVAPDQVDPSHYLLERYIERPRPAALSLYYRVKPAIPRPVQLAVRRAYARVQARRPFPRWPVEPLLVEAQREEIRRRLSGRDGTLPFVNFWPDRARFGFMFTHDVEGPSGVQAIPRLLEIEQRHGIVSSWNFVAEEYNVDPILFAELRSVGCEVALHGIKHDGRLFENRERFEAALPKIRHYMEQWGAVGFRSPATLRRAEWMHELATVGCMYDSSFWDTNPFEPQPGGCCSIFPYRIGDLVELPITLLQDHTMLEILRDEDIARWRDKTRWIMHEHGLVNLLVHPDYMDSERRLRLYSEFLDFLRSQPNGWHALAADVASWWKLREEVSPAEAGSNPRRVGSSDVLPTLAHAVVRDGVVTYEH